MRGIVVRLGIGVLVLAAGCSPSGGSYTGASAYTPSPSASGFLTAGSCAARDGSTYRQVACDDATALARVTVRRAHGDAVTPDCPATTDFVLTVDGATGTAGSTGATSGASPPPSATPGEQTGYACMRDLSGPHPGDPGGGGGPYTVVGDCVYRERPGVAEETPCGGEHAHVPRFTVTAIVTDRAKCPPATSLYVGLPHGDVGCAGPT
jgi:hypothetical protein